MTKVTAEQANEALLVLKPFLSPLQRNILYAFCRDGEEAQHFRDKVQELATLVKSMPETYEQDGLGMDAIVHLHYFGGAHDFYITEKDKSADPDHHQAFGYASEQGEGEFGYISLPEILGSRVPVELDLYWKPKTLKEVLKG